jgi:hypothetical protein
MLLVERAFLVLEHALGVEDGDDPAFQPRAVLGEKLTGS